MDLKLTLVLDASPALLSAMNNMAEALKGGIIATPTTVKADKPAKKTAAPPAEMPEKEESNAAMAPAPEKEEAKEAAKPEAPAAPEVKVSMETLRVVASPLVKDLSTRSKVEAVLKQLGAAKLTELKPAQYAEAYELLKAIA
jgi:hypothetical protein